MGSSTEATVPEKKNRRVASRPTSGRTTKKGASSRRNFRANEESEYEEAVDAQNDSVVAELFRDTGAEVLKILDQGGDIVQYLAGDSPICPLFGKNVTKGEFLGKGERGSVYELFIPNQGTAKYAVKESEPAVTVLSARKRGELGIRTVQDLINHNLAVGVDENVTLKYNKLDLTISRATILDGPEDYYEPNFLASCVSDVSYVRFDDPRAETVVPVGSVVCDESYSELINGLIAGSFYGREKSINFVNAFYFASCPDPSTTFGRVQLTFMEQISASLKERMYEVAPYLDSIVLQTIHAIAVLQTQQIMHNDLHPGNIFLQAVDPGTTWKGQLVADAEFWEYSVGGSSFYLPACPYIVKIGDWGMTCKYSTPMALQDYVMDPGFIVDGQAVIPNFYSPAYDLVYCIEAIFAELEFRKNNDGKPDPDDPKGKILRAAPITPEVRLFLGSLFSTILGVNVQNLAEERSLAFYKDGRPHLSKLSSQYSYITPAAVLYNRNLLGKYMTKPAGAKILRMGEL